MRGILDHGSLWLYLSFEQVNGKLDRYCRMEYPRRKNQGGRGDNHSHLKQHSLPSIKAGVRCPMDYTYCFACLIFQYFPHVLHCLILMKTILYSATTKTPIKLHELLHDYQLFTPHFFGIVEISTQVHSFLNGGISYLVDQPISSSFPRSVDLKRNWPN